MLWMLFAQVDGGWVAAIIVAAGGVIYGVIREISAYRAKKSADVAHERAANVDQTLKIVDASNEQLLLILENTNKHAEGLRNELDKHTEKYTAKCVEATLYQAQRDAARQEAEQLREQVRKLRRGHDDASSEGASN